MLAYTITLEVVSTIIIPAQTHTNKQCLKQGSTNKQANNVNQPEQIDEGMAGNLTRAIQLCPKNGYPKISIRIGGNTFSVKPISSIYHPCHCRGPVCWFLIHWPLKRHCCFRDLSPARVVKNRAPEGLLVMFMYVLL